MRTNHIQLKFRTNQPSGLLFFVGPGEDEVDYLALLMKEGSLVFVYNLGAGSVQVSTGSTNSHARLDDGFWHTVVIQRDELEASLAVDGKNGKRAVKGSASTLFPWLPQVSRSTS